MSKSKHNLPVQSTPFVGRTAELADLASRLADDACRLVTLLGPGGIGKTRLALETAERQREHFTEVYFVPLQAVVQPELIITEIADAIQLRLPQGTDPRERLLEHLAPRAMLLVLDNFEHVLEGVDVVTDILAAAPAIKIIATSREALNLQEEWLWPVAGMDYPALDTLTDEQIARLENYSAVRLFVQHARRIRADFVFNEEARGAARITALVEGMPLGLELAATWVRVLNCEEIADEIERGLDILNTRARNVPQRHRSMRAVLEHSWALLPAGEQRMFRRLAVFRGGFTREAAQAVAGAPLSGLSALVDKSLLRHDVAGRYDIHELVRQYAEEQLASDPAENEDAHTSHTEYFMTFLAEQWPDLIGARPKEALQAIEDEIRNVRAAWRWGIRAKLEDALARGLDSLWFFYDTRSWYREGEQALRRAIEAFSVPDPAAEGSLLLGRLYSALALMLNSLSRYDEAFADLDTALAIVRRVGNVREEGVSLFRQGEVYAFSGAWGTAKDIFQAALPLLEAAEEIWLAAYALTWIANSSDLPVDEIAALRQQSYDLYRSIDSQWGLAIATVFLAFVRLDEQDYPEALRLAQTGLEMCQDIGIHWAVSMALWTLGVVAHQMERYQSAVWCLGESIHIALEHHLAHMVRNGSYLLAGTLHALGNIEYAKEFLAIALHYVSDGVGPAFRGDEVGEKLSRGEFDAVLARSRQMTDPGAAARAALLELEALEVDTNGQTREVEIPAATSAPPRAAGGIPGTRHPALIDPLTDRERDVLQLVAEGLSNREIADELVLARGTVKWYVSQIFSKLGVANRTQAAARARELDLLG